MHTTYPPHTPTLSIYFSYKHPVNSLYKRLRLPLCLIDAYPPSCYNTPSAHILSTHLPYQHTNPHNHSSTFPNNLLSTLYHIRLLRGFASAAREELEGITWKLVTAQDRYKKQVLVGLKNDPIFSLYRQKAYGGVNRTTVDDLVAAEMAGVVGGGTTTTTQMTGGGGIGATLYASSSAATTTNYQYHPTTAKYNSQQQQQQQSSVGRGKGLEEVEPLLNQVTDAPPPPLQINTQIPVTATFLQLTHLEKSTFISNLMKQTNHPHSPLYLPTITPPYITLHHLLLLVVALVVVVLPLVVVAAVGWGAGCFGRSCAFPLRAP